MIRLRHVLPLLLAATAASGAELTAKQFAAPYVLELRVSPRQQVTETSMRFTITDADGKPVATNGARGHADFSSGGLRGRATLYPDGVNGMKGYGLMSAKPDLSIEVSITIPGAAPIKAAFKSLQ